MKVHLIGICGTAMATLAALLKRRGHDVRGSDEGVYPPIGNAVSRGNPELEEVLDRKIRHASLPETIREHFLWGARSIVIAGTHGKTTTAALTGWLLTHAATDPTVFVGGIALNFGDAGASYRVGHGREFVIEGDEYDSASRSAASSTSCRGAASCCSAVTAPMQPRCGRSPRRQWKPSAPVSSRTGARTRWRWPMA